MHAGGVSGGGGGYGKKDPLEVRRDIIDIPPKVPVKIYEKPDTTYTFYGVSLGQGLIFHHFFVTLFKNCFFFFFFFSLLSAKSSLCFRVIRKRKHDMLTILCKG